MRLTPRDRRLLGKLATARWLTTRQIAALCFPGVSLEMARRRLRLLGQERYIRSWQSNQMAEAFHTIASAGRIVLVERGWTRQIRLEQSLPKNLEHFLGINDIRVAMEGAVLKRNRTLGFFYACWELQQQGWPFKVIPDAVCMIEQADVATTTLFEYDRGEESAQFVIKTKFEPYAEGLAGFPFARVVLVADSEKRLEQIRLLAAVIKEPELFAYVLRESLLDGTWIADDLIL